MGSRFSKPGASIRSTNFVLLLPVESQIGLCPHELTPHSARLEDALVSGPFFQGVKLKVLEAGCSLWFRSGVRSA